MGSEVKKDCSLCLNRRIIVSENGYHHACCLSGRSAVACLYGRKDRFVFDWRLKDEKRSSAD